MNITNFENLLRAINKLGASQAIAGLSRELEGGLLDVDPSDIVYGEHGLYYVDERGIITRVIVHIVDKSIGHFEYQNKLAIERDEFDAEGVIERSHRYHLVNCSTLRRAQTEGWRDRYKTTQKRTGRFHYRFLRHNRVYKTNANQQLHACFNCLRDINSKHRPQTNFNRENFSPDIFFSDEFRDSWLVNSRYQVDTESVPNCYQRDWAEISAKYKAKVGYQCEGPDCRYKDLSDQEMRQFLHCHHVNMDITNNNFSNLRALCLECHARQPNHGHMQTIEYREYISVIDRLLAQKNVDIR